MFRHRLLRLTQSAFQLRGPLADDLRARTLHWLLVSFLIWMICQTVITSPLFSVRKLAAAALGIFNITFCSVALLVLHRGALRRAAYIFLTGLWVFATILITFNRGIHSPGLVYYVALPLSAAWLLEYRATLWTAAICLGASLILALLDFAGVSLPAYFPGAPIAVWAQLVTAIVIAGVPVGYVLRVVADALSQSRRAETELRNQRDLVTAIIETVPVGIVRSDCNARVTFANSKAALLLGMSAEEAASVEYADWNLTTPDGAAFPEQDRPFNRIRTTLQPVYDVRCSLLRTRRDPVQLSINAAPIVLPSGEFGGMVAALEDVTERTRAEIELREHRDHLEELVHQRTAELVAARDEAQAASRAKSAFLANMSHELRTPLNAIIGFSSLLERNGRLEPDERRQVEIVHRSGGHLLAIIDDVLDMAQVESGQIHIKPAANNLDVMLMDVADMMSVRASAKNLYLYVDKGPGLVQAVHCDGPKVRQILINLISNAIHNTEHGGVILRVECIATDRPGHVRVCFDVIDSGSGIPREDQVRIFEPFTQVDDSSGRGGTGLGLAITRRYVELMGGSISVESAVHVGSTFRVQLPCEVAKAALSSEAGVNEVYVHWKPGSQTPYRILVVDDDQNSRGLLECLLRAEGFQVDVANDGQCAIDYFGKNRPDFIWMDWHMPGMNGLEAASRIRQMPGGRDVKIVAITATAFEEQTLAISAAGLDDFIRKPYRPEQILDCMARHLRPNSAPEPPQLVKSAACGAPLVSPNAITSIPAANRLRLAEAIFLLDVERVNAAVEEIAELDASVGDVLREYSERLAYTELLHVLEPGDTHAGKAGP